LTCRLEIGDISVPKKVFISSVSQGMEIYRDAVVKAVDGLDGYSCIKMETFGARDTTSDEFCLRKVRESDASALSKSDPVALA
jgi:Domain of unknown function (DUF4062)